MYSERTNYTYLHIVVIQFCFEKSAQLSVVYTLDFLANCTHYLDIYTIQYNIYYYIYILYIYSV